MVDVDLVRQHGQPGGCRGVEGRTSSPTAAPDGLTAYLKHAFNESDGGVVERWAEALTWQYLSGLEYFEHLWPCDPTAIGKRLQQKGRYRGALTSRLG
jgi:transposase, IS5 family